MVNFFTRHIWGAITLLMVLLLVILKAAGRPVTDVEMGSAFVVIGGSLIVSALVQSKPAADSSQSVPRSLPVLQGAAAFIAGLDWIVAPNGGSHVVGTVLLLCAMAYQMCWARKARRVTRP